MVYKPCFSMILLKSRLSIKIFTLFILSIGMVWQVYRINILYLRFDTVVDINVERQSHIQLPAITICADLDMEASEPLTKIYPDIDHSKLTALQRSELYRSAPIDKLFEHATLFNDIQMTCTIVCTQDARFTNGSFCTDVPCSEYATIRNSLTWARHNVLRRCYTYFHWNDSAQPYYEMLNGERDLININITRSSEQASSVIFTVHSGSYIPWTEDQDFSSFKIGLMEVVSIDYRLTQIKLLEWPYRTNCRNYQEFGTFGWFGCMYSCKINYSKNHFSAWPLDVPATPDIDMSFLSEQLRQSDMYLIHKIHRNCQQICSSSQCTFNEFNHEVKYIQYKFDSKQNDEPTRVYIHRPFNFDVVYKHRPAIDFIEYFSYAGSAVGLWFGFSCTNFFTYVERLVQYFLRKHSTVRSGRLNGFHNDTINKKKRPPNITIMPINTRSGNLMSPINTNLSPTYNKSFNRFPDNVIQYDGPLTS